MPDKYDQAHDKVRAIHGKASEHPCVSCGRPACDWALQTLQNAVLEERIGRFYSDHVEDYAAMCRSCHKKLDFDAETYKDFLSNARNPSPASREARSRNAKAIPKEAQRRGRKKTNALRRRCLSCGVVSNPAGMGAHLRSSQHEGWRDA